MDSDQQTKLHTFRNWRALAVFWTIAASIVLISLVTRQRKMAPADVIMTILSLIVAVLYWRRVRLLQRDLPPR